MTQDASLPSPAIAVLALQDCPRWHIGRAGESSGPYSDDELIALAEAGSLRPEDWVWRSGYARWAPAEAITGLLRPPVLPQPVETFAAPEPEPASDSGIVSASDAALHALLAALHAPPEPSVSYWSQHWQGNLRFGRALLVNGLLMTAPIVILCGWLIHQLGAGGFALGAPLVWLGLVDGAALPSWLAPLSFFLTLLTVAALWIVAVGATAWCLGGILRSFRRRAAGRATDWTHPLSPDLTSAAGS